MNRFERRRRTAIALGCVFCCIAGALALTGGVQAALISAQIAATGSQMSGCSELVWQVSTSNQSAPPLVCGQELVVGSVGDDFMTARGDAGSSYRSDIGLQNGDLILSWSQRDFVSTGPSVYTDTLLYEGYGAGSPAGGCNINGEGPAPNESIPATNPYCSSFRAAVTLIGSGVSYQGAAGIQSGSTDTPDLAGFEFNAAGSGTGSVYAGSMSRTPWTENQYTQRVLTSGSPFGLSGRFQFTSFAQTFDHPAAEG